MPSNFRTDIDEPREQPVNAIVRAVRQTMPRTRTSKRERERTSARLDSATYLLGENGRATQRRFGLELGTGINIGKYGTKSLTITFVRILRRNERREGKREGTAKGSIAREKRMKYQRQKSRRIGDREISIFTVAVFAEVVFRFQRDTSAISSTLLISETRTRSASRLLS